MGKRKNENGSEAGEQSSANATQNNDKKNKKNKTKVDLDFTKSTVAQPILVSY